MTIAFKIEQAKLVLTPTDPLVQKDLPELVTRLASDPSTKDHGDLAVEWQPAAKPALVEPAKPLVDPEWQQWARHYDTLAWQVTSIFTAGSAILAGGYVNARINHADGWVRGVLALAGIGLILFQMFIVGAFRKYRYELYEAVSEADPASPAISIFKKPTGGPWFIYCCVAFVATLPWLFALSKLRSGADEFLSVVVATVAGARGGVAAVAGVAFFAIVGIWRWAKPPILPKRK